MKKLLFAVFVFASLFSKAQGLIINEVSQGESGNREYIEMVVVGPPCTTVDLRGWIVDDNNGVFSAGPASGVGIAGGYIKFSTNSLWSAVNTGTIILIYNGAEISTSITTTSDVNPSDYILIIPINSTTTYFVAYGPYPDFTSSIYSTTTATQSWNSQMSLANTCDGVQIRKPDTSFYHGLAYGSCSITHPFLASYTPNHLLFSQSGADRNFYITNALNYDYNDKRNWTTTTGSSTRTPGLENNSANLAWLNYLRSCTLPIELISFIGYQNNLGNVLKWETASEFNNKEFIVYRSYDGSNYEPVSYTKGNNFPSKYSSLDNTFDYSKTIVYYRLKQVDFDGTFVNSNVIMIKNVLTTDNIMVIKYYNLLGQELDENQLTGFYIKEISYNNGNKTYIKERK